MRRLLALLLLAPLAALAQPAPLLPGTFELTLTPPDGAEVAVDGRATFGVSPAALGGGWTLLLDSGAHLLAFERSAPPTLAGAPFGDARDVAPDAAVRAYVRLADASSGVFSTGTSPPASRNRLTLQETDDAHTVGAFDFAAVSVSPGGAETPLRIAGRFHAVEDPDDGGTGGTGGGANVPPILASGDCPGVWDWVGGIYGGLGSWAGTANETNVGGPATLVDGAAIGGQGWMLQLVNGCNRDYPGGYVMSLATPSGPLRAGLFRMVDGLHPPPTLSPTEVLASVSAPYGRPYVHVSGYVWVASVADGRVRGSYSGLAVPIPSPSQPAVPPLYTSGRFAARDARWVTLPAGVELPDGVTLPPGVTGGGNE